MHELSICQSLLREVERVASAHGSDEIYTITVSVGPLSGVEAGLLGRAFDVARAGTIADRAELRIETAPVMVWCSACEIETPADANALLCGRCHSWQVELRAGDELLLKRVELAERAGAAA